MKKTISLFLLFSVSCFQLLVAISDDKLNDFQSSSVDLETFNEPILKNYTPPRKNAFFAGAVSTLIPGSGYIYLQDYKTAGSLFGSVAAFRGLGYVKNLDSSVRMSSYLLGVNLSRYGVYAAYRDARAYNNFEGYRYSMPTESLKDLALAPFDWSVIKKPEVWGGLLAALSAAVTVGYYAEKSLAKRSERKDSISCNQSKVKQSFSAIEDKDFPLNAFPVGIGEEAFFRGFLQPTFSEFLTPWGGIALSSICFGLAHVSNVLNEPHEERINYYQYTIPLITVFGAYFGWMTYKNNSLKESVALHSWYDFIIFAISASASESISHHKPSFSMSLEF